MKCHTKMGVNIGTLLSKRRWAVRMKIKQLNAHARYVVTCLLGLTRLCHT